MKLRTALLAASVIAAPLAVPLAAQAQVVFGPYVGLEGGTTYSPLEKVDVPPPGPGALRTGSNWGWTGEGSIGYGLGNGIRAEIEGDYLTDQFDHPGYVSGRENKYGAFGNVLYDFDLGYTMAYPYIGVGAGYQWVHEAPFNYNSPAGYVSTFNAKGSFAAQGIAGVAFPISGVPGLSLTVEYRYQEEFSTRHLGTDTPYPIKFNDAQNHSFLLGVRYAFGVAAPAPVAAAPPPAPPPAATPAPAPARTYLVFFDWDKYNLTDKARAIIADAAQASTQVQTTQIQVNGYTDLSGTPRYNYGLSVRRAKAVQAELIRLGVPANEISIMGYGEMDPLVPTAPGVREPQNRRVEIILK